MRRIVVNGCFDVLHLGHLRLLETAKNIDDSFVYVLIDSDRRVKELKGSDRPINNENERVTMLSALKYVDKVEVFDSDQELSDKIKEYNPDIMVKGSDYKYLPIIGAEYCKEIIFCEKLDAHSTTKKISDIINRR